MLILARREADQTEREIHNMVDDEQEQDNPAPTHRSRGIAGLDILFDLVARAAWPTIPILACQLIGHHNMQYYRAKQHHPRDPKQVTLAEHGGTKRPQPGGVVIEIFQPFENLQV